MADKANGVLPMKLRRGDEHTTVWDDGWNSAAREANERIAALEAKLEAAERDAARWRWLRENANGTAWNEHDYMTPEVIDAAIDAQRQEGK